MFLTYTSHTILMAMNDSQCLTKCARVVTMANLPSVLEQRFPSEVVIKVYILLLHIKIVWSLTSALIIVLFHHVMETVYMVSLQFRSI
jgi:hypothetical protein